MFNDMFEDFYKNTDKELSTDDKQLVKKDEETWDTGKEATAYWKNPVPDTLWKN